MKFLNDKDRRTIREAIQRAEATTSGEIVTVIARSSDDYGAIALLWAALIALFSLGPIAAVFPQLAGTYDYLIQLALFVALALLFMWEPVKMKLVPAEIQSTRARRNAYVQFWSQGVNRTRDGTGVLIFVSVAERYVEIIADHGIYARLPQTEWQGIVDRFVRQVNDGQIAEGFVATIDACGKQLSQHFPRAVDDANELRDHLIEI